jgi:hypothetical protein
MDEIINLYNEHLKTSFPDRRGEEILGIDLVLLDSDTAGLISKYIGSRGHRAITERSSKITSKPFITVFWIQQ